MSRKKGTVKKPVPVASSSCRCVVCSELERMLDYAIDTKNVVLADATWRVLGARDGGPITGVCDIKQNVDYSK